MRVQKVRVRPEPELGLTAGEEEILAYVPPGGTASDLLRHLEDAYPNQVARIRGARVRVAGQELAPDEPVPPLTLVELARGP